MSLRNLLFKTPSSGSGSGGGGVTYTHTITVGEYNLADYDMMAYGYGTSSTYGFDDIGAITPARLDGTRIWAVYVAYAESYSQMEWEIILPGDNPDYYAIRLTCGEYSVTLDLEREDPLSYTRYLSTTDEDYEAAMNIVNSFKAAVGKQVPVAIEYVE